jgi:hypothetical protein
MQTCVSTSTHVPFRHSANESHVSVPEELEQGWPSAMTVAQVPPVPPVLPWNGQSPTRHRVRSPHALPPSAHVTAPQVCVPVLQPRPDAQSSSSSHIAPELPGDWHFPVPVPVPVMTQTKGGVQEPSSVHVEPSEIMAVHFMDPGSQ